MSFLFRQACGVHTGCGIRPGGRIPSPAVRDPTALRHGFRSGRRFHSPRPVAFRPKVLTNRRNASPSACMGQPAGRMESGHKGVRQITRLLGTNSRRPCRVNIKAHLLAASDMPLSDVLSGIPPVSPARGVRGRNTGPRGTAGNLPDIAVPGPSRRTGARPCPCGRRRGCARAGHSPFFRGRHGTLPAFFYYRGCPPAVPSFPVRPTSLPGRPPPVVSWMEREGCAGRIEGRSRMSPSRI